MRIERVRRAPRRLDITVRVRADEADRTSPQIAQRMLAFLPQMAHHLCENDEGRTFADELADTEVAHLFEHVALELMARGGFPGKPRGETSWDAATDGRGVYVVSLECDDERACRTAAILAEKLVRHVVDGQSAPDLDRGIARLRRMRGLSA